MSWQIFGRKVGLNLFYDPWGVSHVDELLMLFYSHNLPYDAVFDQKDRQVARNMVKLWTNFAKTGDPNGDGLNVKWER